MPAWNGAEVTAKYEDPVAATQVIGCVMRNPELLEDTGRYVMRDEDFTNQLHKVVLMAVSAIYANGGTAITAKAIDDTLSGFPESYATYKASRGNEWVAHAMSECEPENFDMYYNRVKKMTLLRQYSAGGIDMSWLLDTDELDPSKRQAQAKALDDVTAAEIADEIENRVSQVRAKYVDNLDDQTLAVGDGLEELMESLKSEPEFGAPLYGPYINTVTRGARLGKFYMRSAATGVGNIR